MAHGWLAHLGGDAVEVRSAGTHPKGVHPLAVEVMREAGVDIGGHTSDHVDQYAGEPFDAAITVCDNAREACPIFPRAGRTVHRAFEDPDHPELADRDPAAFKALFRRIRDEIGDWSRQFLTDEGVAVAREK